MEEMGNNKHTLVDHVIDKLQSRFASTPDEPSTVDKLIRERRESSAKERGEEQMRDSKPK